MGLRSYFAWVPSSCSQRSTSVVSHDDGVRSPSTGPHQMIDSKDRAHISPEPVWVVTTAHGVTFPKSTRKAAEERALVCRKSGGYGIETVYPEYSFEISTGQCTTYRPMLMSKLNSRASPPLLSPNRLQPPRECKEAANNHVPPNDARVGTKHEAVPRLVPRVRWLRGWSED